MVRVLFVCMGNICRSPTAAAAFRRLLERENLSEKVCVESAGTHAYHAGEGADRRASKAAAERGIDLSRHVARAVRGDDFLTFDYLLAMDRDNHAELAARSPPECRAALRLFMEFAPEAGSLEVPDPYYGGRDGFRYVLDLIEAAAQGLLEDVKRRLA